MSPGRPTARLRRLGSVFLHLKEEIDWHGMFHDLIDGFDAAKLARRHKCAVKDVGVPETP